MLLHLLIGWFVSEPRMQEYKDGGRQGGRDTGQNRTLVYSLGPLPFLLNMQLFTNALILVALPGMASVLKPSAACIDSMQLAVLMHALERDHYHQA